MLVLGPQSYPGSGATVTFSVSAVGLADTGRDGFSLVAEEVFVMRQQPMTMTEEASLEVVDG